MWNGINFLKQYFSSTTTNSINFAYKWTIDNFSLLYDEDHTWKWTICSDRFSPPNNEVFKFELVLNPKGEVRKDHFWISFGLFDALQMLDGKIRCEWNVSIECANRDICKTGGLDAYCLFSNKIQSFGLKYCDLLNNSSKFLPHDKLTLHFEIHLQADDRIFNVITNNEQGRSRFDCANKVTKVEHTWTVENFGDLFLEGAVIPPFIQSDHFSVQSQQFCLRLHPNGLCDQVKDYVDVVVWNDSENSANVHWRISILDFDGDECDTRGTDWKIGDVFQCNKNILFYYNKFRKTTKIDSKNGSGFQLYRDYLLNYSNGLVHENKVKIYCEMSYMVDASEIKKTLTHAQMWDSVHKSESNFNIALKSIHYVSHQWNIDKFSTRCLNSPKNGPIDSEIIEAPTDTRFAYLFRLYPSGYDGQNQANLSFDLHFLSQDIRQVTAQYRISTLNAIGDKSRQRLVGQTTISQYEKATLSKEIPRAYFQHPQIINEYLPNHRLTILCEIWALQDRKKYNTKNISPNGKTTLSNTVPTTLNNVNFNGSYVQFNSTSQIGGFVDLKNTYEIPK